jgi:hypothetical protein
VSSGFDLQHQSPLGEGGGSSSSLGTIPSSSHREYDVADMDFGLSLDYFRAMYGKKQSIWGGTRFYLIFFICCQWFAYFALFLSVCFSDWSCQQTRRFYREQLPIIVRMDETNSANKIPLEIRARAAAQARIALRLYARERCVFSGRVAAELYDGLRHFCDHGVWATQGMTWEQLKSKYIEEAKLQLGLGSLNEAVLEFAYQRIIERSSSTNSLIDSITDSNDFDRRRPLSVQRAMLMLLRDLLKDQIISSMVRNRRKSHVLNIDKRGSPTLHSANSAPVFVDSTTSSVGSYEYDSCGFNFEEVEDDCTVCVE